MIFLHGGHVAFIVSHLFTSIYQMQPKTFLTLVSLVVNVQPAKLWYLYLFFNARALQTKDRNREAGMLGLLLSIGTHF
jgi:hypothetical protein